MGWGWSGGHQPHPDHVDEERAKRAYQRNTTCYYQREGMVAMQAKVDGCLYRHSSGTVPSVQKTLNHYVRVLPYPEQLTVSVVLWRASHNCGRNTQPVLHSSHARSHARHLICTVSCHPHSDPRI